MKDQFVVIKIKCRKKKQIFEKTKKNSFFFFIYIPILARTIRQMQTIVLYQYRNGIYQLFAFIRFRSMALVSHFVQ